MDSVISVASSGPGKSTGKARVQSSGMCLWGGGGYKKALNLGHKISKRQCDLPQTLLMGSELSLPLGPF